MRLRYVLYMLSIAVLHAVAFSSFMAITAQFDRTWIAVPINLVFLIAVNGIGAVILWVIHWVAAAILYGLFGEGFANILFTIVSLVLLYPGLALGAKLLNLGPGAWIQVSGFHLGVDLLH